MVRYSKKYGKAAEEAVSWGFESVLNFLFRASENFVYKQQHRKSFHDEFIGFSGAELTKRQTSNMIYELKRHKYIEVDESGERAIRLTGKAKIKIVEKIVESSTIDHKFRFVSFDIPERLHYRRDQFRRTIKRMGFRQIQQSLWVADKNIGELVEIAAEEFKVSEYVAYIVSEKSNIDTLVDTTLSTK